MSEETLEKGTGTEELAEEYPELANKLQRLREGGAELKEAVRRVLQEDYLTDKAESSKQVEAIHKTIGMNKMDIDRIKGQVSRTSQKVRDSRLRSVVDRSIKV